MGLMRKETDLYSSKNIFLLVAVFVSVFFLLYAIGRSWHESQKIDTELEVIRIKNKEDLEEIEIRKKKVQYVQTAEFKDKEAKTQLEKKQAGEQQIVFLEKKQLLLPPSASTVSEKEVVLEWTPPQKWTWLFLYSRNGLLYKKPDGTFL
jgi:hypothetical protein